MCPVCSAPGDPVAHFALSVPAGGPEARFSFALQQSQLGPKQPTNQTLTTHSAIFTLCFSRRIVHSEGRISVASLDCCKSWRVAPRVDAILRRQSRSGMVVLALKPEAL